jgi:hypothetical protein
VNVAREEAIAELWRRGEIWFKLFPDQLEVYRFVRNSTAKIIVINLCRQWGKSFTSALDAIEFANRNPGSLIRYVAGSQKALRKIVGPIFSEILRDCPEELRPVYNAADTCWRFANGSEIHIAAANDGHADDSRGQRAHRCYVEEAGFVDNLGYLVTSVLLPQTKTTGGQIVLISTPPETPAHDFWAFADRAEASGAYIVRTIDDDRHTPEAEKEVLIREMGGRDSTRAQRELWCLRIVDEERAVLPEFAGDRALRMVSEVPGPTYEQPLVSMDLGWEDRTGILFGYYDFKRAKLCIQQEVLLRRARTDQIVAQAKEIEAALWKEKRVPQRTCDAPLLVLADIGSFHNYAVSPPVKDETEAMINQVRMWVKDEKIQIDPRCRQLVAQMKSAIWNRTRKGFERNAEGHSDLVAALVYLVRLAPVWENPYPVLQEGVSIQTHQIDPALLGTQPGHSAKQLAKMFGRA